MLTLKVESPSLRLPPKVYVVCGPTTGCGRAFLAGPECCPFCGQQTPLRRTPPAIVTLFEQLFNWEYGS